MGQAERPPAWSYAGVEQESHDTERRSDRLLLIEGRDAIAAQIVTALTGQGERHVEWARSLAEGLPRVAQPGIAAILLNLSLPDSAGIETFDTIMAAAGRHIPILVLCSAHHERIARLAVEHGADDFLFEDHFDRYALTRAVNRMLERHEKDDALFAERERAEVTLNSIGDAVLSTDRSGNVTYLNAIAEAMTGWSRAEAAGQPLATIFNIVDATTREPSLDPLALAVRENRVVSLTPNCILVGRNGGEFPIEDSAAPIHDRRGQVIGAVIVFRDVSVARQMSTQLSHLAHYDFLTDLPNRVLLHDRLHHAISLARRHGQRIAVLFLDLDRFKQINDSLSHLVGDQLLQAIAMRLTSSVRGSDTVSRHGGDEFVVVLSELDGAEDARLSVTKLLAALSKPYQIGARELCAPVSIGVSIYPDDADAADTLISHADAAMYYAKENGRHGYQFFKPDMIVRALERQLIDSNLRVALERDEFPLPHQPNIDLTT